MNRYLNKNTNRIIYGDKPCGIDEFYYIEIPDDGKEYIFQNGQVIEKPKDFKVEQTQTLLDIKNTHLEYLANLQKETKVVNGLTFDLSDNFYNQTKARIENAKKLGVTSVFSRDNNNIFFKFTIEQAEQLLTALDQYRLELWIKQELSFIKKWLLENPFKVASSVEDLDSIAKNFSIDVTDEEVQQLVKMTPEERTAYIDNMANNFLK